MEPLVKTWLDSLTFEQANQVHMYFDATPNVSIEIEEYLEEKWGIASWT